MKEMQIKIENKTGLHARPATLLVNYAKQFKSKVTIIKGEKEADIKSIISLLSLCVAPNESVTLRAVGEDEHKAIDDIVNFVRDLAD